MVKVKPNDPCYCESGKKYKKCCFLEDEAKRVEENVYQQSEMMVDSLSILQRNFPNITFKNVSDKLATGTYKSLQLQYIRKNVCMVAERTKKSEKLFSERDPEEEEYDLLLMYHGAYRILHGGANVNMYIMSLKSFFVDPTQATLPKKENEA